jgi:NAD-dependent deacetylase
MMSKAIEEAQTAEYMVIVGTSLQVYPAASLIDFVPLQAQVFVVDPDNIRVSRRKSIQYFQEQATTGLEKLKTLLTGS